MGVNPNLGYKPTVYTSPGLISCPLYPVMLLLNGHKHKPADMQAHAGACRYLSYPVSGPHMLLLITIFVIYDASDVLSTVNHVAFIWFDFAHFIDIHKRIDLMHSEGWYVLTSRDWKGQFFVIV